MNGTTRTHPTLLSLDPVAAGWTADELSSRYASYPASAARVASRAAAASLVRNRALHRALPPRPHTTRFSAGQLTSWYRAAMETALSTRHTSHQHASQTLPSAS